MNPVSTIESMAAQDRQGVVLLATLGERQTIRYVLEEVAESIRVLEASKYQFKVLIVDDSRDSEFNDHVNTAFNDLCISGKVIDGPKNGLGGAIVYGFETVLADPTIGFVVNLDADGQHDARQMPDLVRAHFATESSITIGSRWTKGGTSPGLSRKRKILSKVSAAMLHRVGVPSSVKDPTTSFRVYSRNALEKCWREVIDFNGYAFFGGVIAVATSFNLSVSEVPIRFRPRWAGESKMKLSRIFETALSLWSIKSRSNLILTRSKLELKYNRPSENSIQSGEVNHKVMICAETSTAKNLVGYLQEHIAGDVLEVGAGTGSFSPLLSELCKHLVALEPNKSYFLNLGKATAMNSNVTIFNKTLVNLDNEYESVLPRMEFDCLIYLHVLEHIEDDIQELRLTQKFVSENGKIIVVVPSMPRLFGSVDSLSGHFRRYTKREITAIARISGYEVEDVKYFNPLAIFPYWLLYRVFKLENVGQGQMGIYDRFIVPLAYKVINVFGNRIPGINLIVILRPKHQE
jgi:2-polyprenyl-3-methyl-5-hydroxy-6-metoxy-1,4-benzoquinol methylase